MIFKKLLVTSLVAATIAFHAQAVLAATSSDTTSCPEAGHALPRGYNGVGVTEVFKKLNAKKFVKDEYESKAEFEARTAQLIENLIPGATKGICMVFAEDGPLDYRYDAEAQTLWLGMFINYRSFSTQTPWALYHSHVFSAVKRSGRSEARSTVLGVTRDVEVSTRTVHALAVGADIIAQAVVAAGGKEIDGNWSLPVQMDSASARSLKGKVALAVKLNLESPYVVKEEDFERATLDMPFEANVERTLLVAHIQAVYAYAVTTGEVLATYKFE